MRAAILTLLSVTLAIACNRESPTAPPVSPTPPPAAKATLEGRTIAPNGAPVANVAIRVISAFDKVLATTVSDAEGRFTVSGLEPASYNLMLRAGNAEEQSAGRVRLIAGTNVHDLLVSTCKVPYGTVRDEATGQPIAGAKVTIFYLETITDQNGHYQVDFGCDYVQGSTIIMSAEHPDYERGQTLSRASFLCTCAWDFLLKRK